MDAGISTGPFEWWRYCLGHGAINNSPLPSRVIEGVKQLKPSLIRIFLQEYFNIYPAHGSFDWSILDPYMDALSQTGASVVATINLKPPVLFPVVDETIWWPNDVAEWQEVIYQLVKRYSVDRQIVTHWEHANEPDIGESGACPYLIPTAEENFEFYQTLIQPVLAVCSPDPDVRVQAATQPGKLSVLAVSYNQGAARDGVVTLHFNDLVPGVRTLTAYRIDDDQHWSLETMELLPIEQRTVAVLPEFGYQFYLPADSVLLVTLANVN